MLNQATCEEPAQHPLDDGAKRGRYTRAQISTPPHLPAGETSANQERVPVCNGEKSLR